MKWFLHKENDEYWEIVNVKTKPTIEKMVRLENAQGDYLFYTIQENDEIVQSNWNTILYNYYKNNQNSQCGWINPKGEFFGCAKHDHARCIYTISNMNELNAEQANWIKIYYDPSLSKIMPERSRADGYGWWIKDIQYITKAQKDELLMRGFNV